MARHLSLAADWQTFARAVELADLPAEIVTLMRDAFYCGASSYQLILLGAAKHASAAAAWRRLEGEIEIYLREQPGPAAESN